MTENQLMVEGASKRFGGVVANDKISLAVPRGSIRNVVERDSLELLGIEHDRIRPQENKTQTLVQGKQEK